MTERPSVRLRAERAALQMEATDPAAEVSRRATAVLILHQRMDGRGCLCGWNRLGQLHARHQMEEILKSGLVLSSGSAPETGRSTHGT